MQIGAPLQHDPELRLQWVEVSSSLQIPAFHIIGLPAPEVSEARERVRAAIESSGLEFPRRRVVLNLSPASVRKRGTGLDLAIALAVLGARAGQKSSQPRASVGPSAAWGELGLDGRLKPAGQVTRTVYAAWKGGARRLLLARADLPSALSGIDLIIRSGLLVGPPPEIVPVDDLIGAWESLSGQSGRSTPPAPTAPMGPQPVPDLPAPAIPPGEVPLLSVSPAIERVLVLAAAGAHHLLLLGPRGTGKSHALEWLQAIQPPPSAELQLRQRLIRELAGLEWTESDERAVVRRVGMGTPPAALVGGAGSAGDTTVRPGEFSLAHGGLLLADELPEWPRDSREALREPLETGSVTITRARLSMRLPARFALGANGNLCACGGWPDEFPLPLEGGSPESLACRCGPAAKRAYLGRISGPVLDRIDLVFLLGRYAETKHRYEPRQRLAELRERVADVSLSAELEYGMPPGQIPGPQLEMILRDMPAWREWESRSHGLREASLRGRHKIARTALTIALWDGVGDPGPAQFAEAACYRPERFGFGL